MDKRKEMVLAYKESTRPVGVYQFVNNNNSKRLVAASPNLDGARNRIYFELEKKWIESLQPFGERGYNKLPKN